MTYIYQRMSAADIARELLADEYAGWNYEQAAALAKYLIEYAESTGEPLKFDRVAIRCDFSGYDSAIEAAADYGRAFEDEDEAITYLEGVTQVIQCGNGGIVVQQF